MRSDLVHRAAAPLDMHVDFILQRRLFRYRPTRAHAAGLLGQPLFWHCDLPRMQQAHYAGAILGVHYWPWQSERAWKECNRQIDLIDALCEHPATRRVRSFADWHYAKEQNQMAFGVGIEGAHQLNGKLERVQELARRHVTYLTLTHFSKNDAVTPCMGRGANEQDGLTGWGHELVHELNRTGIAVDVAHVNGPGVLDVCNISRAPVLATHTCARGLYPSARGIGDAQIDAIAATGGVIGVIFGTHFLCGKRKATTHVIADHIDYIVRRVGVDHVGFGSDYDGWLAAIPSDQRDCRDSHKLTDILLERGYSSHDIYKMYRGNTLRALRRVEAIARQSAAPWLSNSSA